MAENKTLRKQEFSCTSGPVVGIRKGIGLAFFPISSEISLRIWMVYKIYSALNKKRRGCVRLEGTESNISVSLFEETKGTPIFLEWYQDNFPFFKVCSHWRYKYSCEKWALEFWCSYQFNLVNIRKMHCSWHFSFLTKRKVTSCHHLHEQNKGQTFF